MVTPETKKTGASPCGTTLFQNVKNRGMQGDFYKLDLFSTTTHAYAAFSPLQNEPAARNVKRNSENKRRAQHVEDGRIKWIQENQILYAKDMAGKRNFQKRNELWSQKAAEQGVPEKELRRWWKSIRTRYGKLSNRKSGDGARRMSDRDKYILERLNFLQPYISRRSGRQNRDLKRTTASSPAMEPQKAGPSGLQSGIQTPPQRVRRASNMERREGKDARVQAIQEKYEEFRKVMKEVDSVITQCPNDLWHLWLSADGKDLDERSTFMRICKDWEKQQQQQQHEQKAKCVLHYVREAQQYVADPQQPVVVQQVPLLQTSTGHSVWIVVGMP